jgi:hypothetical protein
MRSGSGEAKGSGSLVLTTGQFIQGEEKSGSGEIPAVLA